MVGFLIILCWTIEACAAQAAARRLVPSAQATVRRFATVRDVTQPPIFRPTGGTMAERQAQYMRWLEVNRLNTAQRSQVARAIVTTRNAQRSPAGRQNLAENFQLRDRIVAGNRNLPTPLEGTVFFPAKETDAVRQALGFIGVTPQKMPRLEAQINDLSMVASTPFGLIFAPEYVVSLSLFFEKLISGKALSAYAKEKIGRALFVLYHEYAHIMREHSVRGTDLMEVMQQLPLPQSPIDYQAFLRMRRTSERTADNYAIRMIAEHFSPEIATTILREVLHFWQLHDQRDAVEFSRATGTVQNDSQLTSLRETEHDLGGDYHHYFSERIKSVQNALDMLKQKTQQVAPEGDSENMQMLEKRDAAMWAKAYQSLKEQLVLRHAQDIKRAQSSGQL